MLSARRDRQTGITLASVLVGMSIGLLVLSGLMAGYLLTVQAATGNLRQTRLNQELRAILELLRLDLQRTGYWQTAPETDPFANPFQRAIAHIDNDLRLGAASGEPADSCLLYTYDENADGRIGVCAGCAPTVAPFTSAPYAIVNMEMFGIRLRDGAVQSRVSLSGNGDGNFDCGSGRWEGLSSAEIQITRLRFAIARARINLNPARPPDAPCVTGDHCLERRVLDLELGGRLTDDHWIRQTLATRIALPNDRPFIAP